VNRRVSRDHRTIEPDILLRENRGGELRKHHGRSHLLAKRCHHGIGECILFSGP